MAGDLPFGEILTVQHEDLGDDLAEAAAAPADQGRVLQRYGDRVQIRLAERDGDGAVLPELSDDVLERLTQTERLGVQALQLRASPAWEQTKAARPREGELWDMPGCAVPAPRILRRQRPPQGSGPVTAAGAVATADMPLAAGATPTSSYLKGSVAVGVVIVSGPTAATQFTAEERTKVVAEVQAGLGWLAAVNAWAGVSFNYDIRPVTIITQPDADAEDNESRWRDPAMAAVGFAATWDGVGDYVQWLRADRRTTWAYCTFFVKGYPLDHFGYASIGGPRIVMDYANDGWGPDNIDRVFAHETGHIFGAPDEYPSSGCDCGGIWGRFGEPNSNCENCAGGGGVSCLMRSNEWAMCMPTKRHLGWGLTSLRTRQPAAVHVISRSIDKLDVFATDGVGGTVTAAWEPLMPTWWEGWWSLLGGRAAPGAPVTAVSRRPDFLDIFVVGTDGRAYTAAWAPEQGWRGWWRIGNAEFPAGTVLHVVSRSQDKLDVFGTDTSGRTITAAWEPAFPDGWHGWWHVQGGRARAGSPVTAVSRRPDFLDIFVVGTDGRAYTAAWAPEQGWRGWWRISDASFPHGAPLHVVSRSRDKLDVFGTDSGGRTITAAWEPAFPDGWHGWWHIRGGRANPGAPVTAVSRSADKLDIFVLGTDATTYTAVWEPASRDGWRGWWNLNGGRAAHGSAITCVSRRADFLDVFVVGLDGRPYTAAWSPGSAWGGWWPMGL